jgi:hypothetical protein
MWLVAEMVKATIRRPFPALLEQLALGDRCAWRIGVAAPAIGQGLDEDARDRFLDTRLAQLVIGESGDRADFGGDPLDLIGRYDVMQLRDQANIALHPIQALLLNAIDANAPFPRGGL